MNILASFFVESLFHALTFYFGSFHQKFDEIFFKLCYLFGIVPNKFMKPLTRQLHFSFFSCKNRMCHHKFKLNAWNNGWTKKKPRYSSESPWFPEYYISWIVIGNCHQETSIGYCTAITKSHEIIVDIFFFFVSFFLYVSMQKIVFN